jgi:uncharacterized membrane protein (DUF2068 family)
MNWSLRHCARHGHYTYKPDEEDLSAHLTVETAVGQAWRCLRCGDYVVGEPTGTGPAEDAPEIPRGRALRDLLILRLLSIDRGVKGLFLILAAFSVWRFKSAQAGINGVLATEIPLLRPVWAQLGWNIDHSFLITAGQKLLVISPAVLNWIAIGLLVYAAIQLTESVGLWLAKVWGEYFAVIASSVFLPLEIWEIVHTPTILKVVVFIVNIAAVVWLIMSKRLFGVRGGQAAHHAEQASASFLNVKTKAGTLSHRTR